MLNFLWSELSILSNNVRPYPFLIYNILDNLENLQLRSSNLRRRVSLTESNGSIFNGLEVDCDAKGSSQFVITGVTTANGLRWIIYFVWDSMCAKFMRWGLEQANK